MNAVDYALSVIPGDPRRENEDYAGILGHSAVVIDGSGLPGGLPTGCLHGVPWYVRQLGARILARMVISPDSSLPEILAGSIAKVAALHAGTCDLTAPGTPSAALTMARIGPQTLDYLVLGDCTLAVEPRHSASRNITATTDRRMDLVATDAYQAMLRIPIGTPEKQAARITFVQQQRPLRNSPDGYPLAAAVPGAAYHSITESIPVGDVRRVIMMSDGAARWVEFGLGTWDSTFEQLDQIGPRRFLRQLRDAEDGDPAGERWPRAKLHDDAAVIYWTPW